MLGLGVRLPLLARVANSRYPAPLRTFWQRVRADSGTMIYMDGATAAYRATLAVSPSLLTTASAYKAGVIYSVLPTDGSGDFDVSRATASVQLNENTLEAVAANVPVIDTVAGVKGIRVNPQASNLIARFINFTNAAWAKDNTTVDDNGGAKYADPAGGLDAYKLIADANNGTISLTTPTTVVSGTTYTNLIYAKRVTGTGNVSIIDVNNADRLVTVTDDWTPLIDTRAATSTSGQIGIKLATAGDEILIYNANQVAGVIDRPVTINASLDGTLVTRNADVISKTGASALIGQTEGTFFIDFEITQLGLDGCPIVIYNPAALGGGVQGRILIQITQDNQIQARIQFDSSSGTYGLFTLGTDRIFKIAIGYKVNNSVIVANGSVKGTRSTTTIPSNLSSINVGSFQTNAGQSSLIIHDFWLTNTRLSDTELQQLTTL